jgi:hypothetical protein
MAVRNHRGDRDQFSSYGHLDHHGSSIRATGGLRRLRRGRVGGAKRHIESGPSLLPVPPATAPEARAGATVLPTLPLGIAKIGGGAHRPLYAETR